MRTRWKFLIALAAVMVIVLTAAFAIWRISQPTGVFAQTYRGRTLHEWIELENSSSAVPDSVEVIEEAIHTLATNHVPELIATLDYDSAPREARMRTALRWLPYRIYDWLDSGPLRDRRFVHAEDAIRAFRFIGPEINGALPHIAELAATNNYEISERAWLVMQGAGANALPELERLAAGANSSIAERAYMALGGLDVCALPCLLKAAGDEKNPHQPVALLALQQLLSEADMDKERDALLPAIPVLERGAASADINIAQLSRDALEEFKSAADPDASNTNAPTQ